MSEYLKNNFFNWEKQDKSVKRKYKCAFCRKVLPTYVGLKVHVRRHVGSNLHTCGVCKKRFPKSNRLRHHMLTHEGKVEIKSSDNNEKDKFMECEFCHRKFKYRKNFNQHMHNKHGTLDKTDVPLRSLLEKAEVKCKEEVAVPQERDETNDADVINNDVKPNIDSIPNNEIPMMAKNPKCYTCHVCNVQFDRPNHLTRHMTLHKAVLIHKCHRCDKAFATTDYLAKHVQEDHINKPYTCLICDKTYARGEQLIRHLKAHLNPTELDIKCSMCDKQFTRSDQLVKHIKLHLQQDKRHICDKCGKVFKRLDHLETHQRIHTGKQKSKLLLCIYCGKEFKYLCHMIIHIRRHTGEKPYKCSYCDKGFPSTTDLNCHERTHSGEKPCVCKLCGKAFSVSNKLLRHIRSHTGEHPYVCKVCGKAFAQSNVLSLHMRRHTGEKPYACGVCPARFIQSGQLKAHRRSTGHCMEMQPDLKGGHRVKPVISLSDPVPIKFKTHGKKKLEEETQVQETKVSQPHLNSPDAVMQPTVMEGDHHVKSVLPLSDSVPIEFETHSKKKLKEEIEVQETKVSLPNDNSGDAIMEPIMEDTKLLPQYSLNEVVTFNAVKEEVDQLNVKIKNEVQ